MKKYKVLVFGLGYVGLANSLLLAKTCDVIGVDILKYKIDLLNNKQSPIKDKEIESYLKHSKAKFKLISQINDEIKKSDFILISTPTNFDEKSGSYDTKSIYEIINNSLKNGFKGCFIIKSTIPIKFTSKLISHFNYDKIFFSPEFLREGKALHDCLFPSRIVIGYDKSKTNCKNYVSIFCDLLKSCAEKKNIQIYITALEEAEAIKLFSNTFLAMRIAFFNELDTFAEINKIDSKSIIEAVCADERIGNYYNNPSFGYGGYCLPKDTKQLEANYKFIPENLISSIVKSNITRKKFIADTIASIVFKNNKHPVVGIFRLTMKNNSDNLRNSAVIDIADMLSKKKIKVIAYEPLIKNKIPFIEFVNTKKELLEKSNLIICNRKSNDFKKKGVVIYTRDIFGEN